MSVALPPFAALPPPLPVGGTVGIVAPSRWPRPALLAEAQTRLEELGYRVKIHPQVLAHENRFAGSDEARAAALKDFFLDPAVDAVMCARGGAGALRILELIDYEALRAHPKPLVGFSDATALLTAVMLRTGMATYHGPMLHSFAAADRDVRTENDFRAVLGAAAGSVRRLAFPDVAVARAGEVEGRLIGGSMTLLQCLIGTAFDWPSEGAILFIEEVNEHLYRLDRIMTHLRLAGRLKGLRAVLVGEAVGLTDDEEPVDTPFGKSLREIVLEHAPEGVPVAFDVPCGHGRFITSLPIGAAVRARLGQNGVELTFGP